MKKKKTLHMITITVGIVVVTLISFAKYKRISPLSWGIHSKVNQAAFSDEAINGYDPVAYFTQKQAVKGNASFAHRWNDATWFFSSQENLDLFRNFPEAYAPQFGGYCAFAAGKGFAANTDPNAFTVIDGKLYLCSEPDFLNRWLQGGEESLKQSEQNWR